MIHRLEIDACRNEDEEKAAPAEDQPPSGDRRWCSLCLYASLLTHLSLILEHLPVDNGGNVLIPMITCAKKSRQKGKISFRNADRRPEGLLGLQAWKKNH